MVHHIYVINIYKEIRKMKKQLKKPVRKSPKKVFAYVTVEGAGNSCKNNVC